MLCEYEVRKQQIGYIGKLWNMLPDGDRLAVSASFKGHLDGFLCDW